MVPVTSMTPVLALPSALSPNTPMTPPPVVSTQRYALPPSGDAGNPADTGFATTGDWYVWNAVAGALVKLYVTGDRMDFPLAVPGDAGMNEKSFSFTLVSAPSG